MLRGRMGINPVSILLEIQKPSGSLLWRGRIKRIFSSGFKSQGNARVTGPLSSGREIMTQHTGANKEDTTRTASTVSKFPLGKETL